MANSIYQQLHKETPNMMESFQQFMQNPFQALISKNLNIPVEMQSSPQTMVQHLVNSGQISQDTFNKAFQTAQRMGVKF